MSGRTDKVTGNRCFVCDHVISVINMMIQRIDQICLVLVQKAEHLFRAGGGYLQGDAGILPVEGLELAAKQPVAQGGGGRNPDMAADLALPVRPFFALIQNGSRVFVEFALSNSALYKCTLPANFCQEPYRIFCGKFL